MAASPPSPAPARRRGRPPGSASALLRRQGVLGLHHFAFLRCWFLRLDLRSAWQRYLAFAEPVSDLRRIERRRTELLRQVLDAGHQLNLGLPPAQQLTSDLALLAREPFAPASAPLPSLDAFAESQGLDREFYSEAELQQEYNAFYGLHQPAEAGGEPRSAADAPLQVRALNRLEPLLTRPPAATDTVDLWLSAGVAGCLRRAGIGTLATLADFVRAWGWGWFRRVPGLGEARAARLLAWLSPVAEGFGAPLPALAPPQRQRALADATLARLVAAPRFALVPLEQLAVPPPLAGPGRFATGQPNHLGAANDLQALQVWLAQYAPVPATQRAYAKEVERFYLWCLHVRRKPLSSVDSSDCTAWRDFLAGPPTAWIQPLRVGRSDPAWRPFRGPLSPRSQKYALVVVQALFDGLQAAHYVLGNPMSAVNKKLPLRAGGIDADRSFTDEEWRFACARAAALPAGPAARRLQLVLDLLAATGLRLSELAGATWDDLRHVRVDGESDLAPVLTVRGKGGRLREVPLPDALVPALQRHRDDAATAGALPSPAPLICTLAARPPRWRPAADGGAVLERAGGEPAGLGAPGLYALLKRFFKRIAADAHAVDGLSRERMLAASTHWLRHTFARQGAAAEVPVEVLQQALGHASLATTTVYLSTERSRMVRELRKADRLRLAMRGD